MDTWLETGHHIIVTVVRCPNAQKTNARLTRAECSRSAFLPPSTRNKHQIDAMATDQFIANKFNTISVFVCMPLLFSLILSAAQLKARAAWKCRRERHEQGRQQTQFQFV